MEISYTNWNRFNLASPVGLENTIVLPPSRPAASKAPPEPCIYMGSIPTWEHKKEATPNGVASYLAPPVGLEPTTCGLTVRRSTD